MMNRAGLILTCLLLSVVLAGCGQRQAPLNIEEEISVEVGDIKSKIVPAPVRDQKVSVTVRCPGEDIDVYLVSEKDHDGVVELIKEGKEPDAGKIIGKKLKVREGTLEATIQKGNGFAVIVANPLGNDAKVALKITGN